MKWFLDELTDGVSVDETYVYDELIKLRYELVSLEPVNITGTIKYHAGEGLIDLKFHIKATVLAANTGDPVEIDEVVAVTDTISDAETVVIDNETTELDFTPYVKEHIDLLIPSYVVDESQTVPKAKGSEWKYMSEDEFMLTLEQKETVNKFANLSQLLNEKNKDE